jgi:hypothetical protein
MHDREALAWAAGFFDGEGSVFCHKKEPRLQVSISQIDPRVLDKFAEAVGLGKVYGPFKGSTPQTPRWNYVIQNIEGAYAVFDLLSPWLGEVKKQQFLRAFANFDAFAVPVAPGEIAHLHAPGVSAGNPRLTPRRKKVV